MRKLAANLTLVIILVFSIMMVVLGWYTLNNLQQELATAGTMLLIVVTGGLIILALVALGSGVILMVTTTGQNVIAGLENIKRERLKTDEHRALVAQRQREANTVITVAKPGDQVYLTERWPDTLTRPLHLTPGRVNGHVEDVGLDALERWQLHQLAHATARHSDPLPASTAMSALGPGLAWPERVNLLNLLPDGQGSLNNLILGVTIENGTLHTISAPLAKMVHVAVGGASGWGKSEFLRAIAFQVATAPEPTELCFVDLEAATFSPFAKSGKLRYPIADSERDILAILTDLQDELKRRKALFSVYPEADKLTVYNQLAAEPLPEIVLLIDEMTALFSDNPEIEQAARTLVLRARKYGIFTVAGGQSWKASDLDSSIRSQFSTTVHFHAKDKASSRVLLGDAAAADIDHIGRAYVILPGQRMIEMQAPALSLMNVLKVLESGQNAGSVPALSIPAPPEPEPSPEALADQLFVDLVRAGKSRNEAALKAWGRSYGGNLVERGRRLLGEI